MASQVVNRGGPDYLGLRDIFEFTNHDGVHTRANCGQAACATFLTHHRNLTPHRETMGAVESRFPPDILGGLFGTSRRCVTRICRAFGLQLQSVEGEKELRAQLAVGNPVLVMLGVSAGRNLRWQIPGGHWMVAYGFDEDHVYLTNWGCMTWPEFRSGWTRLVPRLISMRERGLALQYPNRDSAEEQKTVSPQD